MINQRGFALITTLWVVAALGMLVSVGLASVDVDQRAAENRILMRRAQWAGRACLAMVLARYSPPARDLTVDSTDLGRGVWCWVEQLDPSQRLNINRADSVALTRVLGDPYLTAALLDWRDSDAVPRPGGGEAEWYRTEGRPTPRNGPFASLVELQRVRGFEDAPLALLESLATVRGDGRIDPNRAPVPVLGGLAYLSDRAVATLTQARQAGTRLDDAEEVVVAARAQIGATEFRDLTRRLVFEPREHVVRVLSGASSGDRTVQASLVATLSRAGDHLRVRRLEVGP